jgi:2'-5' RNA ligase
MPLTRCHATAFLGSPASRALEELRRTWDPGMAKQIAAHITLIYPEEITDPAELAERTEHAAARIAPFTIAAGRPFHAGSPADGVFLHVSDPDDGIGRFRGAAIPHGRAIAFLPHITIVHPRTSRRGERAWAELAQVHIDTRFTIAEVAITAYDGRRWPTLQAVPLTGPQD